MLKRLQALWTAVKGWKTIVVSAALAVVGVLQTADWATIVRPQHVGPTILGVAVVVAVLRTLTDTPIGRRDRMPTSGGDAG